MSTAASTLQSTTAAPVLERSEGVWHAAWRRFKADRVGVVALVVVIAFLALDSDFLTGKTIPVNGGL